MFSIVRKYYSIYFIVVAVIMVMYLYVIVDILKHKFSLNLASEHQTAAKLLIGFILMNSLRINHLNQLNYEVKRN